MKTDLFQQPDALIFDMDGTLWDGVETYAQGFNDFFKKEQIDRQLTKDDLKHLMGLEEDEFLEAALPEFSKTERKIAYKEIIDFQYKRIESDGGVLYDGVKKGLPQLSEKYKLFIVSNCPRYTIDYFVKWAKIENIITESLAHGKNYKPKHQNIRFLIKKYGLKNPYYIGDTDSDRKQSHLVPLTFVFVDYGFGTTGKYHLRFSTFVELTDYFMRGFVRK
ncbi:MAG: HAD hydrolase-like protein [Cytophagales bacterium]|nr:HAD hydrolase-like protein [Cytophagales bacterium]